MSKKERFIVRTNEKAIIIVPRLTIVIVLATLAFHSNCVVRRHIDITDVLEAMTAADRKIDNYCSRARSFTYDSTGRLKTGEQRSVHFYAKPDESLLCVNVPFAPSNIYYESGTTVRSLEHGQTSQRTLSDSLFLRDWRSVMRLRLGHLNSPAKPAGGPSPNATDRRLNIQFASGDPQRSLVHSDGVYDIRITRPNQEVAILKVDVPKGVILEKSVYLLPGQALASREIHSDFVPLAGTYLPGKTIYQYGTETVVIYWTDYRVNLPIALNRLPVNEATCTRLLALLPPEPATPERPQPIAAQSLTDAGRPLQD